MEKNDERYSGQGIHLICSIFTVEKGRTKVLLIKRKNNPYNGMWALVGGALYNNETVECGLAREIKEKTGITGVKFVHSGIFSDPKRSPVMRMVALSYVGMLDFNKVKYLTETAKTSDAQLFDIEDIPELAYDHNEILKDGIATLKREILHSDILETFYPNGFTLPEIYMLYETILNKQLDRRNFRKKLLDSGTIKETGEKVIFNGKKPANLYKINKERVDIL